MLELRIVPKLLSMAGSARRESSIMNVILLVAGLTGLAEARELAPVLVAFRTFEAVMNA